MILNTIGRCGFIPPWWRGRASDWNIYWKYQIKKYSTTSLTTATRSTMGASLAGTDKWIGGVLGPDGKIYGIPFNSTDILIIDPILGTATRSAMGASLAGTYKWYGGVLGPDGKIYGIPRNSTNLLIISESEIKLLNMLKGPYLNKL